MRAEILEALATNPRAVERALVLLYARQTSDEQSAQMTKHTNGRGFNSVDARFLSDLARKVQKGWKLSGPQMEWARKLLPKYAGQLAEEAAAKQAAKYAMARARDPLAMEV